MEGDRVELGFRVRKCKRDALVGEIADRNGELVHVDDDDGDVDLRLHLTTLWTLSWL